MAKPVLRALLALFTLGVGVMHFVRPEPFVRMIPAALPAPYALVLVSGVFEILGAIGLFIPRVRRAAAWGLVALYVAVFPANVNMAVNHVDIGGPPLPPIVLWLRLPLQAVFIGLAYWFTRPDAPPEPRA